MDCRPALRPLGFSNQTLSQFEDALNRVTADPITSLHADRDHSSSGLLDFLLEVTVRIAKALMPGYQRFAVGKVFANPIETRSDRLPEQRGGRTTVHIGGNHAADYIGGVSRNNV